MQVYGSERQEHLRFAWSRTHAGFTIVELLVALAVGGLIIGSMVTFFVTQVKSSRMASVRIEAVQRVRFASEILRREISLAGAGIPDAQPLVVYAGPNDIVLSADLASSTPGDRVAVYQLPGAPLQETEGADSGSIVLPNGEVYPRRWYGPSETPGPAETIRLSFVSLGGDEYMLTRTINSGAEETLLRGLKKIQGRDFFSYKVMQEDGEMRDLTAGAIWHEAAIHESTEDKNDSALTDSIKLVRVAFKLSVRGRRADQTVERSFSMAVALKNAGLVRNAACGDSPKLGVVPSVKLTGVDPLAVTVTWAPALDERSGESDVWQYSLYRKELNDARARPIASLPPSPTLPNYAYVDTDLESGKTYVYLLGATDCTPAQSSLSQSAAITIPNV